MEINGREYAFLLTAGAAMDIADMCPGKDLRNFAALLDGSAFPTLEGRAAFICALSRGAEDARAFEEPGYKPQPLTPAFLRIVDLATFNDALAAAAAAFKEGLETTVQAKAKKNEAAAERPNL